MPAGPGRGRRTPRGGRLLIDAGERFERHLAVRGEALVQVGRQALVQVVGPEDGVDAVRQPVGAQHRRLTEAGVTAVVQGHAQVVQVAGQGLLLARVRLPLSGTQGLIGPVVEIAVRHPLQGRLDGRPFLRELPPQTVHVRTIEGRREPGPQLTNDVRAANRPTSGGRAVSRLWERRSVVRAVSRPTSGGRWVIFNSRKSSSRPPVSMSA